jgi:hypothetical protein
MQHVERAETAPPSPEWRRPEGMDYRRYLGAIHLGAPVDWYLEVGCRNGKSFALSRSRTIAVDPFFKVDINVIGKKPALHVFQQTSDDFFASGFLDAIGARLSLSFLDGMHLFEYLLRDVINTEAHSHENGVTILHDCVPYSHEMTTRDLDNLPRGAWTGDVWKLIPILGTYRPDLKIDVMDCRPTGLVLLSNLNPADTTLSDAYDDLIAEWTDVTLEDYGLDRFHAQFDLRNAKEDCKSGLHRFDSLRLDETAALEPTYITP